MLETVNYFLFVVTDLLVVDDDDGRRRRTKIISRRRDLIMSSSPIAKHGIHMKFHLFSSHIPIVEVPFLIYL